MAVLKYYDGDSWEPVVSALQGPTGAAGAIYQTTAPTDTGVLWIDTDDDGELVIPNGGATGAVLTKSSSADYDTEWNVPSPSGLVHIETQVISGVSGVNFSQGVFSSTYDNYLLIFEAVASTNGQVFTRFRTTGSDNNTSNYVNQYLSVTGTTVSAARATQTEARIGYSEGSSTRTGIAVNIFSPNLAQRTTWRSTTISGLSNAYIEDYAGTFIQTTVFDSISVIAQSGNLTGKVALYGYKL